VPDIELTVDPTSVAPTPEGVPVRFVITNAGTQYLQPLELTLFAPVPLTVTVDGAAVPLGRFDGPPQIVNSHTWVMALAAPRPGGSVTITLRLALPAGAELPENGGIPVKLEGNANTRALGTVGAAANISLE
jgi:hypothetical protein